MGVTAVGWTGTPLERKLVLRKDVRFGGDIVLAKGTYKPGYILPGFTFNTHMGCQKIRRACVRCYAKNIMEGVFGYNPQSSDPRRRLKLWGTQQDSVRLRTSAANWRKPARWNRIAGELGVRLKVFCGSLMDIGEDHPDVERSRQDLWPIIDATPNLDWLLLTKRTAILARDWPAQWKASKPRNVWAGATVENQEAAELMIPDLLGINAWLHWLSMEPLCGRLELRSVKTQKTCAKCGQPVVLNALKGFESCGCGVTMLADMISWGVAGGESGPGHETMDMESFFHVEEQFAHSSLPFFPKQDSGHAPGLQGRIPDRIWNVKRWPMSAVIP